MLSMKSIARIAGIGYLIIFVTGIFANFFVIESMVVAGDAQATLQNILENEMLFRYGLISFIVMVVIDLLVAWALYLILIPVNSDLSLASAWLRLVNAAIFGVALFSLVNVLQIVAGSGYKDILTTEQIAAEVMQNLGSFSDAWLIGLVFFGFHLLVLGYLIFRSAYIPGFIGILLVIAGLGYLVDSSAHFMLSQYDEYKDLFMLIVIVPGVVGELSLTVWLLIRGRNVPETTEA